MIGAEPPSPDAGGGVLGGLAGGRQRELGEVTAYVLEKAARRVRRPTGRRRSDAPPRRREASLGDEAGDASGSRSILAPH